jgi:DNA-binding GntR family transcriptional regulator
MSTLASQVYFSLAQQIMLGTLAPGQKLEEKIIADQFGVSRTPVREAMRELSARKLIEFQPRRGGVVAHFGIEQLADMLEAECEVEGLCARLSSRRMSPLEKSELCDAHERARGLVATESLIAYFELNKVFHDLICHGVHNSTLEATVHDLRFRLSPFRRPNLENDQQRIVRSHAEHSVIVDAIVEGNPERAYDAMIAHNARVNATVLRLLRDSSKVQRTHADSRDGRGSGKSL